MGGKKGSKIPVTEYGMSQHLGICVGPCELKSVTIKEKLAVGGLSMTEVDSLYIEELDLFGGVKKEGGVAGTLHFLPGKSDQILPDQLAQKLGRANGADAPGYRGIASAWFTGEGYPRTEGFYWSANIPYLPPTWLEVRRRPVGLTAAIAMVPRGADDPSGEGGDTFTVITDFLSDPAYGWGHWGQEFNGPSTSPNGRYMFSATGWMMLDLQTETVDFKSDVDTGPNGLFFACIDDDLSVYGIPGGGINSLRKYTAYDPALGTTLETFSEICGYLRLFVNPDDSRICVYGAYFGESNHAYVYDVDTDTETQIVNPDTDNHFTVFVQDSYGDAWGISASVATDEVIFWRVHDAGAGTAAPDYNVISGLASAASIAVDAVHTPSGWVVSWNGGEYLYLLDDTDFSILETRNYASGPLEPNNFESPWLAWLPPGATEFWYVGSTSLDTGGVYNTVEKIRASDLATIDSREITDWSVGDDDQSALKYNHVHEALISRDANIFDVTDNPVVIRYFGVDAAPDANPAHIIYEALTNTTWGMGSPSTLIDVDSFEDAAQTLYDEFFGLSMIWTRQSAIQSFIQEVLDHIQAVLFVDPTTGLLTLKLIRGDYDPETLDILTPDNADLTNFSRKLWGEIVNEITVTWTNPVNEEDETVTAHDLASIVTQGGIVPDGRNHYGVRYAELAQKLAQRDLRSAGAPLASCEVEANRSFWTLRPASVVKVTWPEHGLDEVVFRVTNIDYGRPGDATIKLSLVEDVFGLDIGEYIPPASSHWEDPSAPPAPLEVERVITLPLFMAADAVGIGDPSDATYPEVIAGVLGTTSEADTFNFEIWDELALPDGTLVWQSIGVCNILGYGQLAAALDAEAASLDVAITNIIGKTRPSQGGFVFIGDAGDDETEMEIAMITDPAAIDLSRGVLDTVPRRWPAGTHVWFVDGETLFEDGTVRASGEEVSYKLLPRTSQGRLPLADATLVTYELTDRPWLPNRPADVEIGGRGFSSLGDPVDMVARPDPWVTVGWANRNRLTEDGLVLDWTDATVTPEDGQTTTITVLTADGLTVLDTHDGLAGTTFDVPDSSFGTEDIVIIRTSSARTDDLGEFESLQAFDHYVLVAPLRATEESIIRMTEEGGIRQTETNSA